MLARFLYHDAEERERLLDLALRLRPAYALAVLVMVVPAVIGMPVFGFAATAPLLVAAAVYAAAIGTMHRARRPEHHLALSSVTGLVATLVSIWLADGPKEYLFAIPAIPLLGIAPIFARRVSIAAGLAACAGIVGVALASYGAQVQAMPPIVILPVILILVTVLGSVASRNAEAVDRATAMVDPMTGLLNRVALQTRTTELQLPANASADRVGLILADLDDFTRVSTTFGEPAADAILTEAARRLRTEVGNAGTVYRFRGDRFVVLLQSATSGTAIEWAERLREAICFAPIDGVDVTASFGVAVSTPETGFRYRELFVEADTALYRAKDAGRDRVCAASEPSLVLTTGDAARANASADPSIRRATDVAPATSPSAPARTDGHHARGRQTDGGNWLVADALERAHAVDLLNRSRKDSQLNVAVALLGLAACAPWLGGWLLLPPIVAGIAWRICTTRIPESRRPEFAALVGLVLICIAAPIGSILATRPILFGLPLGALVLFGACAGLPRRGAAVIGGSALISTAVAALVIDAGAVAATPFVLVFPLALIIANAIVGEALGRATRELRVASVTDALTGSLNRAALNARIPQLVQHAATSGAPTTIAVVDLDHVSRINAHHGRDAGDAALTEVAARLRGSLRAFDSVYRIGGEGFVVVLTDTAAVDARDIAERARLAVQAEEIAGVRASVSIGVATAPAGEALAYDELYALASGRLREAKLGGRNRVVDGEPERQAATGRPVRRLAGTEAA